MINKTKSAFTLAEVLITLVIIGIVAALTVSAVINTYVERSTVSKVKKGLSTLAQAKKLAEAKNGSIEGWDLDAGVSAQNAAKIWGYIKPYLSVVKDCGSGTDCYQDNNILFLNGNPETYSHNTDSRYYKFVLADGSVMWFRGSGGNESVLGVDNNNTYIAVFFYDVNGIKAPNTLGKDIFLYVMNINGVYPSVANDCSKSSIGWGCSGYIIKHNNMNYLH